MPQGIWGDVAGRDVPVRTALGGTEFFQVVMSRPGDPVDDRTAEITASLGQEVDPISQRFLLFVVESGPLLELVGELDLPHPRSV